MRMNMRSVLEKMGCEDIDTTGARFIDDVGFYLEVTSEMLGDPGFDKLGRQLLDRDEKAAFETAHMLKGMVGNCGVTPMYRTVAAIVETLRRGDPDFDALNDVWRRLSEERDSALETLRKLS